MNRHGWLSRLRSYFILDPLIWAYTLILGTISLVSRSSTAMGVCNTMSARLWSWLIMKTILSPVKVTGMDDVETADPRPSNQRQAPRLCRHPCFGARHSHPLRLFALSISHHLQKRIALVPIHRMAFEAFGQVCINQQNPAASIGSIKSALRSLRSGMPLVIFPEGGRTRDGQIQPFLPGAFFLAIKAQAEIVPIALIGTFDLLPMNTYHIKSQPLEMRVGEPIPTTGLTVADTEEVSARVKAAIEKLHASPRTT